MLTTIREKTQGIIATFILALIGIPFALWGINSYFQDGPRADVASVNGEKISAQLYHARLEAARRDPRMMEDPTFKSALLDSIVDENLLMHDAESQGYRLGDAKLAQLIREYPYFQNNGRFDPALYEAFVRQRRMNRAEFEQQQRSLYVMAQLQLGLTQSGIVTDSEIANVVRLLGQEREIAHALIGTDKFLATVSITSEAVEQYYKAHPEFFRTAEQVRIEYVRLAAPSLIQDYQPSEAELQTAYNEEAAKSAGQETRRAAHILIAVASGAPEADAAKALARAQDLGKQLRGGADFATLARKESADTDSAGKGGDIGEIRRDSELPKPVVDAALSLKTGEVSQPVRSEFGYHLVKLTTLKAPPRKLFAELKPQLVKQLRQRKAEERFYEASEKFRNLVYEKSDSLAPAAEALGLKVESTDWFSRNGGSGVAALPRIVDAAFSTEVLTQGRNSDAIEVSGDSLAALRVVGHRPVELKPLADVRPQIERALRQEGAEKAAREVGEKLVQELASGQSLEAAARKLGVAVQPAKKVLRDQPQGIDPRVVQAAFRAARPEGGKLASGGVELGTKGYAVYAVLGVTERDPAKVDAALRDKAKRLLMMRRGPEYYANYRAGLKQKADIKVYEDRL